jgi:methylmalonyl-CoA/ethylmalonyl-CoA epimerase
LVGHLRTPHDEVATDYQTAGIIAGVIKDVHHVGIAVGDLAQALAFYSDALSLPVVKEGEMRERGVKVAVLAAGRSYLELVQPIADSSPFARHIGERGEGLHHVALWSTDVRADVGKLREAGVPLDDEEPRDGFTGRLSYLKAEAFDGAQVEVVEPEDAMSGKDAPPGPIKRIDHVVLRVPSVSAVSERMSGWFAVETKRTFERGNQEFSFMRPGDVVIEVIGPKEGGEPGSGRIAGLAFEVKGIDDLADQVGRKGYPIGEPHPALQGGRIVSVHQSGTCGVPVAFIDFTGSPGPAHRR